jgi:hypothetical protein
MGWGAFENCTSLTSVAIPTSVTSIASFAFLSARAKTNSDYCVGKGCSSNLGARYVCGS